jgi:hypothetical protein
MTLSQADAKGMAFERFPAFLRQREHAERMDKWRSPDPGRRNLYMPKEEATASDEYKMLADISPTPLLQLVINAVVQITYLDGISKPKMEENLQTYRVWLANGWNKRQSAVYRDTMAHGTSCTLALRGERWLTKEKTIMWSALSAKQMIAFFNEPEDEFPATALYGEPYRVDDEVGFYVRLYDEVNIYYLSCVGMGSELKDWTYISEEAHDSGVVPIIQYDNQMDLEGHSTGEIEPFIPLCRRINQDVFDRLIVQRFGAWKVRYVTGLVKPEGISDEDYKKSVLQLLVGDILVSDNHDTKFGTLDETQLAGFIAAFDNDLRTLSAVTQTPPHHLLGLSSNLQAESLAAVEAGLQRKGLERRISWGESHEKLFRLTAHLLGNKEEAHAFDSQSRWRDMESRSLEQAARALGILATQVGVPVEMLWNRIPNWSETDQIKALKFVESGKAEALMNELANRQMAKGGVLLGNAS